MGKMFRTLFFASAVFFLMGAGSSQTLKAQASKNACNVLTATDIAKLGFPVKPGSFLLYNPGTGLCTFDPPTANSIQGFSLIVEDLGKDTQQPFKKLVSDWADTRGGSPLMSNTNGKFLYKTLSGIGDRAGYVTMEDPLSMKTKGPVVVVVYAVSKAEFIAMGVYDDDVPEMKEGSPKVAVLQGLLKKAISRL
jgi:hypothetical protein